MSTSKTIKNKNTGAELKLKPGATCKTKGIIYAIKCNHIYIGHTGGSMGERFSKHKYDIKTARKKMNWRRTDISTNIMTPKKI